MRKGFKLSALRRACPESSRHTAGWPKWLSDPADKLNETISVLPVTRPARRPQTRSSSWVSLMPVRLTRRAPVEKKCPSRRTIAPRRERRHDRICLVRSRKKPLVITARIQMAMGFNRVRAVILYEDGNVRVLQRTSKHSFRGYSLTHGQASRLNLGRSIRLRSALPSRARSGFFRG